MRVFKSDDTTDGSSVYKLKFAIPAKMHQIHGVLTKIENYEKWLSPIQDVCEIVKVKDVKASLLKSTIESKYKLLIKT